MKSSSIFWKLFCYLPSFTFPPHTWLQFRLWFVCLEKVLSPKICVHIPPICWNCSTVVWGLHLSHRERNFPWQLQSEWFRIPGEYFWGCRLLFRLQGGSGGWLFPWCSWVNGWLVCNFTFYPWIFPCLLLVFFIFFRVVVWWVGIAWKAAASATL